ncbi:MAG TPA: hypothetical protein VN047_09955 [Sphingopyxis sp.]|uniref:hypothetical protein n=1 Tax=Sphingopyxis sp. TaxID=1908224 RepID=UPI002C3A0D74|nr:hypothetical protein [Sphingopyxis sp.]HWW57201.1 hypothetical protein [Sphingopyxis sp.]
MQRDMQQDFTAPHPRPSTYGLFQSWLAKRRNEIGTDDLDLATFICVTSIEALTHAAVIHRPDMISEKQVNDLVEETSRLIIGYLPTSRRAPIKSVIIWPVANLGMA